MKNLAITIFIALIVMTLGLYLVSFQVRETESALVTTSIRCFSASATSESRKTQCCFNIFGRLDFPTLGRRVPSTLF